MSGVQTENDYYLPSGYNDNKIELLARDPHWLYAYWEISNDRKNSFIEEFGPDLWEKSVPVLKVTNVSKNSSFFVRINEFSDNWYINVADTDNLYVAEIGRKLSDRFFINLASSNYVSTPANVVSIDTSALFIDYRELKTGTLDLESKRIIESHEFKQYFNGVFGLSSPELFGIGLGESVLGISSAQLFGISVPENIGISSGFISGISSGNFT